MRNMICILLLSFLIGATPLFPESSTNTTNSSEDVWITVFIHGTLGLQYTFGPYTALRLFVNSIRDTEYENMVELMRQNPAFYKTQAIQEPGLHRITESERELGAWLLRNVYDAMQQQFNPRYAVYYTFGWSGLLSERDRRIAGHSFYRQLKDVYSSWKHAGYTPRISIIGYSHGGTVAEYIAPYHAEDSSSVFSHVDELILLGTPTQRRIDCYAAWPVFKRIYNLRSRGDLFQKIDIFSNSRRWPDKRLQNAACKEQEHIYNIRFSITMPPYCYGEYQYFRKGKYRKNFDPGHIELYFFGLQPSTWLYRQSFPLSPLPAITLVPAIISYESYFPSDDIMCEIWPPEERIQFRERGTCKWDRYHFPICDTISWSQEFVSQYTPDININLLSLYSARKAREIVYTVWEDVYDKC